MEFISENNIREEIGNSFDEELLIELPKKLEKNNYMPPFDGLKDSHLLKAIKIKSFGLTSYLSKSPL